MIDEVEVGIEMVPAEKQPPPPAEEPPLLEKFKRKFRETMVKIGLSDEEIKPYETYEGFILPLTEGERRQRKRKLANTILASLQRKGALASDEESMEFYCKTYNLNRNDPPEKFLESSILKGSISRGEVFYTYQDPRRGIKVYLNPYLYLEDEDIILQTALEEAVHWSQIKRALESGEDPRTVCSEESWLKSEIEAKRKVLKIARYLDLNNASILKIKREIDSYEYWTARQATWEKREKLLQKISALLRRKLKPHPGILYKEVIKDE